MQRTIKVLRIALPIVFLAFVALIVATFDRNTIRRTDEPNIPVTSTQRASDKPQVEAVAFEDTQTIGGRVVSRIRAARVVGFASGWTTLENARITIYRPNNLTYEVICPEAQVHSETKEAEAKGGVRVTSSDGIEIATAEIRFDGQRLTNDIPVQFKIDRWTGNAGGLDMNVEHETLRLFKKIDATMSPAQPNEPPTNLKAEDGVFRRRENDVTFTKGAEMNRAADSLRADTIVGRFTPDRRGLIGFDGNGNARMIMSSNPSPGEDLGGRKEIICEGFFTEVGPDGQISAVNARSGAQPAHAILDGPPKRDIWARSFRVALANKAVSEIKADWQVVMKEYAEVTREINSEHVTVSFDSIAHKPVSAYLEGAFRYSDPKTMATAFRASYDIAGDKILLTTDPGWQATVVSEGNIVKAKQIEFAPKAQTARAIGEVIAQLVSKSGGPTADATNLFPTGKPVFVNADNLVLRQANKVAIFSGNVRAWQEINTILASEMQVQGAGNVITARGGVTTVLYNAQLEPGKKPTPVKSKSDQLVARKGERRLELIGNVTIEDETRVLKSEQSTFFFDANRKIERIEADNKVVVTERPTNRNGTGDKAIYQVTRKMIYVTGNPATMSDPTGTLSGQQIVLDLNRNKVNVVSPTDQTKGSYKHTE